MEHPHIVLFKPALAGKTDKDIDSYLRQHPVLTSTYYNTLLTDWAKTLNPEDRQRAERALSVRAELYQKMKKGKLQVAGPTLVHDLAWKVMEGKYTLPYAQQEAAQPEFFVELMYPVVTSICDLAEKGVRKNWRPAATLMRLLFAALDARRPVIHENQQAMELVAIESWLTVACVACSDVPDGRIFHSAVSRGDAVADLEYGAEPPANILHRLGVLHLDPYVSGRTSGDLDQQLRIWQFRLVEEYGQGLAGIPSEELDLPDIKDALPKAAAYFRRAAARRSGEARGKTLKALAQALHWAGLINAQSDQQECIAVAREALTLLPPDQFRAEHAELNHLIEVFEKRPTAKDSPQIAQAKKLLATPIDKWVEQGNETQTIDIFKMSAGAILDADPDLALKLYMRLEGLMRTQTEARRTEYDKTLLRIVVRAFASPESNPDGTPFGAHLERILETAKRERWSAKKRAQAVFRLAVFTTGTNEEGEGLNALSYCSELEESGEPVFARCIPFLRSVLQVGHAVNAYDAKQFGAAAWLYANAIEGSLEVGQPLAALELVRRLIDLATPGKPESEDALRALIGGLTNKALALEYQAGEAATELIQSACRLAMSILMKGPASTDLILLVFDIAKGRRFRAALTTRGNALNWLNHPRTLALEKDLLALRPQAWSESKSKPEVLDQNLLLASYVSRSEMSGGATASEQLRNLQIQFDSGLDKQLGADQYDGWLPSIEQLRSRLDENVVLLIQYIGTNLEGALDIMTFLISNEDALGAQAIIPTWTAIGLQFSSGDESVKASPLTPGVAQLRDQLASPPGPRAADSRALESLLSDCETYLGGPILPKLQALRAAGKDHLCISPHGPLHFYPFHLLGNEDEPLANEWCITYLPHLHLLEREQASAAGKIELTSIGINFAPDNVFRLGPIEEAEGEARAIAAEYGPLAKLLVGSSANKAAVLAALAGSRHVHISTHGRHNVSAPSFQCIFLRPGSGDEGILYAYELLRLDLRGLDLVTFSACETALGRFDIADNPRGIPALLLTAGVQTIVGTLWNVETNTATYFFTTFYRILRKTRNKKTAFYKAQSETRREFPKYRDWGAFQFIGSWASGTQA